MLDALRRCLGTSQKQSYLAHHSSSLSQYDPEGSDFIKIGFVLAVPEEESFCRRNSMILLTIAVVAIVLALVALSTMAALHHFGISSFAPFNSLSSGWLQGLMYGSGGAAVAITIGALAVKAVSSCKIEKDIHFVETKEDDLSESDEECPSLEETDKVD